MRQRTYLNIMLTINAVLLTALLWTQFVNGPTFSSSAHAEWQQTARDRDGTGIPNAGEQRAEIIRQLRALNEKSDKTHRLLESGNTRVRVANLSEVRAGAADGRGN